MKQKRICCLVLSAIVITAAIVSNLSLFSSALSVFAGGTISSSYDAANTAHAPDIEFAPPVITTQQKQQQQNDEDDEDDNDGEPRIAFITYAHLAKPEKFVKLIFGSLDTFLSDESTYFVVMTPQWKQDYADLCASKNQYNTSYPVDCSRLSPIWVDCVEGYFQPAPSCKFEKGLIQIWEKYQANYDWFLYMDDDDYLRTYAIKSYLSILDPTRAFVVGTSEPRSLGSSYFCPRCKYNCSFDNIDFKTIWGQPVIYSKAGLAHVMGGLRLGGFVTTCSVYGVFHDVGVGVYNWIYSLPALSLGMSQGSRTFSDNLWASRSKKQLIGYHGVANERHPNAEASMASLHDFHYTKTRFDYAEWTAKTPARFNYRWHNVTGFRQTKTYSKWGDPSTWTTKWRHNSTARDCYPMSALPPSSGIAITSPPQPLSKPSSMNSSNVVVAEQKTHTEPRIAFITYASLKRPEKFVKLIFGALDTFLRDESMYFVVMAREWLYEYEDICNPSKKKNKKRKKMKFNTTHPIDCSRLTPIWVDCVEGYHLPSPSCKFDKGLSQVWMEYEHDYDYFLYMDDDDYLRTYVIKSFLSILNPAEAFVVGTSEPRLLGSSYFCPRCPYNCSTDDPNFKAIWGQPMIYSNAGLKRVVHGFRLGGMVATCSAYGVFHDVGIGVYNWMFSLPALSMGMSQGSRVMTDNRWAAKKRKQYIGYHGVANERHPNAEASMVGIHEFHDKVTRVDFENWTTRSPDEFDYRWFNATGFQQTQTYMKWGDPFTWEKAWRHSATHPDCFPLVASKDRPSFLKAKNPGLRKSRPASTFPSNFDFDAIKK